MMVKVYTILIKIQYYLHFYRKMDAPFEVAHLHPPHICKDHFPGKQIL